MATLCERGARLTMLVSPARTSAAVAIALGLANGAVHSAERVAVEVTAMEPGRYRLTTNVTDSVDHRTVQSALLEQAIDACQDKPPLFGRFSFSANEPLHSGHAPGGETGRTEFSQEVHCGVPIAPSSAEGIPPAPGVPPGDADEAHVSQLTRMYLASMDAGRFESARSMIASSALEFLGGDRMATDRAAFNAAAGAAPGASIVRVSWYDDPTDAPTPGRFAAVDYRADYASGAFYCGYVVWLLHADGQYRLVRQEEGVINTEMASRLSAGDRQVVRAQMQCRD